MNLRTSIHPYAYLLIAVSLLSACDQVETIKDKVTGLFGGGLKIGEVYKALDEHRVLSPIRVASKDEVEDGAGTIGKYTVEGDKVRIVFGGLGITKAFHYKITKDGLETEGGEILFSSAKYEAAKSAAGADCRQVKVDLANLAIAEEAYFTDHIIYTTNIQELVGFTPSNGVKIEVARGDQTGYVIKATGGQLCPKEHIWDSDKGGLRP